MTWVVPIGKLSPEWWVWVTVGVMPELSDAKGSVQVTVRRDVPRGMTIGRGSGQEVITGGIVSCCATEEISVKG